MNSTDTSDDVDDDDNDDDEDYIYEEEGTILIEITLLFSFLNKF